MTTNFTESEQQEIEERAQALVRRRRFDNAVRARAREIETASGNSTQSTRESQ